MTVVSGDSRGKTSFWNGKTGTLVDSYQSHKADVLAVAVAKDQQVDISRLSLLSFFLMFISYKTFSFSKSAIKRQKKEPL